MSGVEYLLGGGNPKRHRLVCVACSHGVYLDSRYPASDHETMLKQACPRKPRCKPWADRGCRFEWLPPTPTPDGVPN